MYGCSQSDPDPVAVTVRETQIYTSNTASYYSSSCWKIHSTGGIGDSGTLKYRHLPVLS